MSISEITQLRQRIDLEIAAMNQAKRGYAVVSRHEVITHHLEILGFYLEQLTNQIGEQAAVEMLAEQMERGV
jgi:hypothetical protein